MILVDVVWGKFDVIYRNDQKHWTHWSWYMWGCSSFFFFASCIFCWQFFYNFLLAHSNCHAFVHMLSMEIPCSMYAYHIFCFPYVGNNKILQSFKWYALCHIQIYTSYTYVYVGICNIIINTRSIKCIILNTNIHLCEINRFGMLFP